MTQMYEVYGPSQVRKTLLPLKLLKVLTYGVIYRRQVRKSLISSVIRLQLKIKMQHWPHNMAIDLSLHTLHLMSFPSNMERKEGKKSRFKERREHSLSWSGKNNVITKNTPY